MCVFFVAVCPRVSECAGRAAYFHKSKLSNEFISYFFLPFLFLVHRVHFRFTAGPFRDCKVMTTRKYVSLVIQNDRIESSYCLKQLR